MERSTVSPHYQEVLDNLAENLRAQRREQMVGLLGQASLADVIPIPRPAVQPEYHPTAS